VYQDAAASDPFRLKLGGEKVKYDFTLEPSFDYSQVESGVDKVIAAIHGRGQSKLDNLGFKLSLSTAEAESQINNFTLRLQSTLVLLEQEFSRSPLRFTLDTTHYKVAVDEIIDESLRLKLRTEQLFTQTGEAMVKPLYAAANELVFHSIIPDMVDEIIDNFRRMSQQSSSEAYKLGQDMGKAALSAAGSADAFGAAADVVGKKAKSVGDQINAMSAQVEVALLKASPPLVQLIYIAEKMAAAFKQGKKDSDEWNSGMVAMEKAAYATSSSLVTWLDRTRDLRREAGLAQAAINTLSEEFGRSSAAVSAMNAQYSTLSNISSAFKQFTMQILSGIQQQIVGYYLLAAARSAAMGDIIGLLSYSGKALGVAAAFELLKSAVDSAIPDQEIAKGASELQKLAEELRAIDAIEKVRGERYDELQAKADAYRRTLEALARAGAGESMIQEVAAKLAEVEKQIADRGNAVTASSIESSIGRAMKIPEIELIKPIQASMSASNSQAAPWGGDIIINNPRFEDEQDLDWMMNEMFSRLRRKGVAI
jgi:hypothetical protein